MSTAFNLPLGLPPLPPELAALTAPAAAVEEAPDAIVRQAFRIGQMHLVATFATASELVEMPNVYPLPRMPEHLLGLVNLHGRIVPLFDLAALFETEHLPREKKMLLVIGHGNDAAGLVIDGLPRRAVFSPDDQIIPPALPAAATNSVIGCYLQGKDAWFEFNYASLLDQLVST
ncbi:MAG TPA: chemotaxis protein CheW [Steroidobacteraceae bacterium]|nr:chemotaxis protein CheW [Steroidobacteraceae bacterium]